MSQVKPILSITLLGIYSASMSPATASVDLLLGHFETQIDYELTPGAPDDGWNFSISYNETNDFTSFDDTIRLDPATTTIVATPDTELVLSSSFQGLGDAGDSLWLLPQSNEPGQIFFGWRLAVPTLTFQRISNGSFIPDSLGSLAIELIDVAGPAVDAGGKFAMWERQSTVGVEMHFNSADGIDANDRLDSVPVSAHTHYNYALTQPGNYEVTFRASGRLNPWQPDGGQDTSGEFTMNFAVPFSSVATGGADLKLSLGNGQTTAAVHPANETVEYAPNQVMLITQAIELDETLHPYAFCFDTIISSTAPEPHRVGITGVEPVAFPDGFTAAPDLLNITDTRGPGSLQLITDTQGQTCFVFSDPGIYRVQLNAVGMDGGTPVNGNTFELTFLAGLAADYDFASYADSFERTHNLAPGSLKDDGSDWDGDGFADIIEYQLFWEGFDPGVSDASRLPKPDPEDPDGLIVFYRDTYKDRLNRNTENIVLEYTADFSEWTGWSDRDNGFPLDQFESGARIGNAHARIQRRALRLPEASPSQGFFRWRIDPAN